MSAYVGILKNLKKLQDASIHRELVIPAVLRGVSRGTRPEESESEPEKEPASERERERESARARERERESTEEQKPASASAQSDRGACETSQIAVRCTPVHDSHFLVQLFKQCAPGRGALRSNSD